jgi:hypothetical protein
MTESITIPESYRSYLGNAAIKSAVNDLIEKKTSNIPKDFDWESIQQYHEALFSASRVRRDYTMMLFALMDEVFLVPAKEKGFGKKAILPLNDWWDDTEPSPKNVWENGLFCCLKFPGGTSEPLGFFLAHNEDDGRIQVEISIPIPSENLTIGDGWAYDEEDEWWKFNGDESLTSIEGKSEIVVGALRDVVKRALEKILSGC